HVTHVLDFLHRRVGRDQEHVVLLAIRLFLLPGGVLGSFLRAHFGLTLRDLEALRIQLALFALRIFGGHAVTVVRDTVFVGPFVSLLAGRFGWRPGLGLRHGHDEGAREQCRQDECDFAHAGYFAPEIAPGDTAATPQSRW